MKRRSFLKNAAIATVTVATPAASLVAAEQVGQVADAVFYNGKVVTVDKTFSIVQAFAVKGNKILATGSSADMLALAGEKTVRTDLKGKTVLPGLIDSHLHATGAARSEFSAPTPEFETIAEVLQWYHEQAAVVPKGEWIRLDQIFITRLKDLRYPTRDELDDAAPDHLLCFRTGPDCVLNTKAMEHCGLLGGTPKIKFSLLESDAKTGKLNGIVRNFSGIPGRAFKATPAEMSAMFAKLMSRYNSVGLTTISERGTNDAGFAMMQGLREKGLSNAGLSCRIAVMHSVNRDLPTPEIRKHIDKITKSGYSRTDNGVWLQGLKFYVDGGMLTGSAAMIEPYGVSKVYGINDPEYKGVLFVTPEKTVEIARAILDFGLQPSAHTVGDLGVKTLVDAYAVVNKSYPVAKFRPCISHANFTNEQIMDTMKEVGVIADMQPAWLYLDGAALLGHFGQRRLGGFQPYRTLLDKGIVVGGGSDHMLKIDPERSNNRYNPFLGIETMLTRKARWLDEPIHPEQCVTREEAIRFYTSVNAWVLNREDVLGSLEKGKLADFIVIDRDILTCDANTIKDTVVLQTWLDGACVYRK